MHLSNISQISRQVVLEIKYDSLTCVLFEKKNWGGAQLSKYFNLQYKLSTILAVCFLWICWSHIYYAAKFEKQINASIERIYQFYFKNISM